MTQFSDPLYLGAAVTGMGSSQTPSPSDVGVGPMAKEYMWNVVPLTKGAANIAASQTPTATLTLTAGTGTTSVTRPDGTVVVQLDCPRALVVVQAAAGTQRAFTVTGWDIYGQPMSEAITSTVNATVTGKKAFYQIASITVPGTTTTACTIGTSDTLGIPVLVSTFPYFIKAGWDVAIAADAGTLVLGVATSPATTTTGDVRGTYIPSSATDGTKRLSALLYIPASGSGSAATRAGALGVNQNLVV